MHKLHAIRRYNAMHGMHGTCARVFVYLSSVDVRAIVFCDFITSAKGNTL